MRPIALILALLSLLTGLYGLFTLIGGTTRNATRDVMSFSEAIQGTGIILFAVILGTLAMAALLIEIAEHLRTPTTESRIEPEHPYSQEEAEREAERLMRQRGA